MQTLNASLTRVCWPTAWRVSIVAKLGSFRRIAGWPMNREQMMEAANESSA